MKNGCRVFASDMKFRALTGDFDYLPDVMIVCDQEDMRLLQRKALFDCRGIFHEYSDH